MTTVARLSVWVPPERMDEFEEVYERQLAPVLRPHGLEETVEGDRSPVAGVCSRLFVVEEPAAVLDHKQRLQRDPAWQQTLQQLAADLSVGHDPLSYHFGLYRTPVGPGRTVEAGPGLRQGLWYSLGLKDGAPLGIQAILQDRQNVLWLARG